MWGLLHRIRDTGVYLQLSFCMSLSALGISSKVQEIEME